jgi:hypothetical protein
MKRAFVQPLLWAAALASLLIGMALSFGTVRLIAEAREDLRLKRELMSRLLVLESGLAPYRAAREAVEALVPFRPRSIGALIDETIPGRTPDDLRTERKGLMEGWVLCETEVSFRELGIREAMELTGAAAAERPPWRLIRGVIRASAQTPGTGQVVLRFETLEPPAIER